MNNSFDITFNSNVSLDDYNVKPENLLHKLGTDLRAHSSLLKSISSFLKLIGEKNCIETVKSLRRIIKNLISIQNVKGGKTNFTNLVPQLRMITDPVSRKKFFAALSDATTLSYHALEVAKKISDFVSQGNSLSSILGESLNTFDQYMPYITLKCK